MFNKKPATVDFSDFMSGEYKSTRKTRNVKNSGILAGISTIPLIVMGGVGSPAFASGGEAIPVSVVDGISDAAKSKIIHAFDPLIDLMVSVSLPIAGVMLTGGALLIMIGQKDSGFRLIMNSALGYVLVQMSPLFIDLLGGVGAAI